MTEHHVEIFRDDNTGLWGWQCFTEGCKREQSNVVDCATADEHADQHRKGEL